MPLVQEHAGQRTAYVRDVGRALPNVLSGTMYGLRRRSDEMNLNRQANGIQTREDFVLFVQKLLQDLRQNPDDWENRCTEAYLDAIAAWVEDIEGFFLNQEMSVPQQPDWRLLGQILLAAKYYE